ncbi:Acetyl-coenzyme A synthetase [Acropora cervicornis]|uniref:Acetyl-coenzyme A synthetase n=1 Tax=Acropora cervicornis TaxID=6130 RepID=A0AAD9QJC2_ACRCE|nr:Acetyl-coenzyme A synthetase [Acropora cervicornis]
MESSQNEHEKELSGWFYPSDKMKSEAYVSSMDNYKEMYTKSIENPAEFWGDYASEFFWKVSPSKDPDKFMRFNFDTKKDRVLIKWMEGAVTNISYNLLDRNVGRGLGETVAFFWEGNSPEDSKQITYRELLSEVCKFANVLKDKGIQKGDRVAIYMPMIIELVVAMLACARIGAVHSIVFGGFSAESLAERILDSTCKILITADGSYRGKKLINLKEISDDAIAKCREKGVSLESCIVVQHVGGDSKNGCASPVSKKPCPDLKTNFDESGIDCWWHDLMSLASDKCEPCWTDAEDPLFMLYTSGSTGKPKGVLHTVGGYMLYTACTFKYVFDYHPGEVYWCTADIGWITGHSYITYGPMANGATSVLFEGTPFYPDSGRFWDVVDKYKVSKFYTAPTAIRALMKFGKAVVNKYNRKSLKVLGTVGEPINPEAWLWYYRTVGDERCSIVDTYWQTETGGHVITPLPGATPMRPGAASFPFFGVVPAIVDEQGNELEGACEGFLVMKQAWPGMARTIYGNHERFEEVYFSKFPGYYTTGDGCKRDSEGFYWITGRTDDCMNVSGHLLSTAQIESALVEHNAVTEAAVVSCPHKYKGEGIYCFTTLMEGVEFSDELKNELKVKVRTKIGPFAAPDVIQSAPGLPKTRSGKIMRRVLRKIARNDRNIGDITTMADSTVVETLFENRPHVDFMPE